MIKDELYNKLCDILEIIDPEYTCNFNDKFMKLKKKDLEEILNKLTSELRSIAMAMLLPYLEERMNNE